MRLNNHINSITRAVFLTLVLVLVAAFLPGGAVSGAPAVTTVSAANITETSATLTGMIAGLAEDAKATLYFEYGTDTGYGRQVNAATRTSRGSFSATVSGLVAGTVYHFRAVADLGDGVVYGFDSAFTTGGSPTQSASTVATDIQVTTWAARDVDSNRATLAGEIKFLGERQRPVKVWFEWGESTGYGQTTQVSTRSAEGELTAPLTGLTAGVAYHYRLRVDSGTGGIAYGSDMLFNTPRTLPEVFTLSATGVTDNITRFNGQLASLGRATQVALSFEYGTTSSYGERTNPVTTSSTGNYDTQVTGLTSGVVWHIRARADAVDGGVAYGADVSYTPGAAYVLTIAINGSGTVLPAVGPHTYSPGTVIDLDASPSPDWKFEGWSGDVTDNATSLKLTLNGSKNVTANFSTTKITNVKLAYTVDNVDGALFYTINNDGSGKQRLPLAAGPYMEPVFSPDNSLIAYINGTETGSQLAIMNANSSGARLITAGEGDARAPAWSPDGKTIAFAWESNSTSLIYVMNFESATIKRLTDSSGYETSPAWSVDGQRLAFASDRESENMEIWVMNRDGSAQTRLTTSPGVFDWNPSWSPDGSQLAWEASGKDGSFVYIMQADGKSPRKLTAGKAPVWLPDGRIVFTLNRDGTGELWSINPDGTGLIRLAVK